MIEELLTPVMYAIPSLYKQYKQDDNIEIKDNNISSSSNQSNQSKHPLYHTIIIDEKVIQKKRGIILLTHQITKEEFQSLYLNDSSDLNEIEMLERCNSIKDFTQEIENKNNESIKNEIDLLNDNRIHFISYENISNY